MPDTVNIPHVGHVRKAYLYAGAAVVAGFVGVAYYRSSASAGAPDPAAPAGDATSVGVGDTSYPTGGAAGYDYGGSAASDSTVGAVISTNAQWYAAAYEAATGAGWESMVTAAALGKFLARQPLTEQESQIVRVGLAAAGQPPVGQPWAIVPTGAPKPPDKGHVSKPPKPGGLHVISVSGTTVRIGWDSVPWVSGYVIFVDGSEHGPMHFGTWYTLRNMPTGQHTISVRTMNRYKVLSDAASVTVNVAAPPKPRQPDKPKSVTR